MAEEEFSGTDRFRLLAKLGAGSMGAVYRAYDQQQRREVALKTLERAGATSLYRFKREFRALADVAHPNLVCLYELLSERNHWFFTMELLDGVRFRSWVHRCEQDVPEESSHPGASSGISYATVPERDGFAPVPNGVIAHRGPARTCDLARLRPALRQLVLGVDALHKAGWLHRDIKPSNVVVARDGRVVLVDFGLVTERDHESIRSSIARRVVGTPAYLSPEQAACAPLGPASDWYSVGVLLYEALTGRLPFDGEVGEVLDSKQRRDPVPPSDLVPVPADLDELCMALLRRRPEDRPDAAEMLSRLGERNPPATTAAADRRPTVFVGRSKELRELEEACMATRSGKAVVFHVHGSSGMGKSALVEEFLDRVRADRSATVLAGRCYERESVPYKALDSVIDALSHELRRLGRDAAALLPRDVWPLVRLFPVLKRAKAVDAAPLPAFDTPDPQQLRRRAFGALKELLAPSTRSAAAPSREARMKSMAW